MYTYFKDKALQEEFEKNGFIRVKILSDESITALSKLYKTVKPFYIGQTFCNLYKCSPEKNKTISDAIKSYVEVFVNENMIDCGVMGACYIAKGRGTKTGVNYHQDWIITDEKKYNSLAVWIPLTDTTKENGALSIIPGSHKWPGVIRSHTISSLYVDINKVPLQEQLTLNLAAGEAVIYSQNIFHGSWPNMSKHNRIAVNATVLPKVAERVYIHKGKDNTVNAYDVPNGFHYDMIKGINKGKYPAALKLHNFDFSGYKNMTEELFFDLLKAH